MPANVPGVGAAFKAIRQSLGLNKQEAAQVAGVDQSYVTLFERDDYAPHYDRASDMWSKLRAAGADEDLLAAWFSACGYIPRNVNGVSKALWLEFIDAAKLLPYEQRSVVAAMRKAKAEVRAKRAKGVAV